MELHRNEATAGLSVFEESLEYLISLNGREVCSFTIFLSVVEQKSLNKNILAECYCFQYHRHLTAGKLDSQQGLKAPFSSLVQMVVKKSKSP